MKAITQFAVSVMLFVASAVVYATPNEVDLSTRAGLQSAMQQHIDRHLVEGAYLQVNLENGSIRPLHPAAAHPMILRMGEHFVLCTDFRDREGKSVNVDFYVARRGKGYVVFHTEIENRGPLERLMKASKVVMLK